MTEPKKILRWLTVAAMLQSALILLVAVVLTTRLSAVRSGLRDSLYISEVTAQQVDKVNEAFSSISSDIVWIFLIGMVLTSVGYGLLRSTIIKSWPKPSPQDRAGS